MGIYSRDYVREDRPGGGFGESSGEWAIKYLLIANIAVFLLQNLSPQVTEWFELRLGSQSVVQTGKNPSAFFEYDELQDGLPAQIAVPDPKQPPDARIPPRTSVELLTQYGDFSAVRWENRYGLVASRALQTKMWIDPFLSYQLLWRLLTYGFCHGSLMHIAFNMYFLWMFGRMLVPIYGSREFMAIYLVGVVISGLGHIAFSIVQGTPAAAIGASGGVMAITFLCAMLYPRLQLLVMFIIPVQLRWFAVIYAVIDVMGLFNPESGVAHAAHLGGAAFGVAYKHFDWRLIPFWQQLTGWFSRIKRARRGPKVRIYQPSDDKALATEVDTILQKIHEQGEASLTDKERETLKEASRRFKR